MLSSCDNTAPVVASSLRLPLFTSFQYLPVFPTSKPPLSPQRTPIDPVILCPADNDTDGSFFKLDLKEFRLEIPAVKLPGEVADLIMGLKICLSDNLSQVQQWCVGSKLTERYLWRVTWHFMTSLIFIDHLNTAFYSFESIPSWQRDSWFMNTVKPIISSPSYWFMLNCIYK